MTPERMAWRVCGVRPVWIGGLLVGNGSGVPVSQEGGRDEARMQETRPRDDTEGVGPGQGAPSPALRGTPSR